MANNFTNQPLDRAIVPLQVGKSGKWREQWDGSFTPLSEHDNFTRQRWHIIHGVYAFRDADQPLLNGTAQVSYAEAAMLCTDHMHDFCGGVQASSASVRITSPNSRNSWGEITDPRAGRLVPKLFNKTAYMQPGVTVPLIHDALLADRALTHKEVESILRRSLMFWSLSFLYSIGKRGMICMDRANEHTGYSRQVLRAASELTWLSSAPLWADPSASEVNPGLHLVGDPTAPRQFSFINSDYPVRKTTVLAAVDEGDVWYNYNSGNPVGPVQVYFTTAPNFQTKEQDQDEEDDVEYDEENDEYIRTSKPLREEDTVTVPEWYTKCAHTLQHVRMFPRNIFNN